MILILWELACMYVMSVIGNGKIILNFQTPLYLSTETNLFIVKRRIL